MGMVKAMMKVKRVQGARELSKEVVEKEMLNRSICNSHSNLFQYHTVVRSEQLQLEFDEVTISYGPDGVAHKRSSLFFDGVPTCNIFKERLAQENVQVESKGVTLRRRQTTLMKPEVLTKVSVKVE